MRSQGCESEQLLPVFAVVSIKGFWPSCPERPHQVCRVLRVLRVTASFASPKLLQSTSLSAAQRFGDRRARRLRPCRSFDVQHYTENYKHLPQSCPSNITFCIIFLLACWLRTVATFQVLLPHTTLRFQSQVLFYSSSACPSIFSSVFLKSSGTWIFTKEKCRSGKANSMRYTQKFNQDKKKMERCFVQWILIPCMFAGFVCTW